jgi:tetratricopeptide (TPR) repeat protein
VYARQQPTGKQDTRVKDQAAKPATTKSEGVKPAFQTKPPVVANPAPPANGPTQKELLGKAAQLLKENKPADAAKLYRQAIALYPQAFEPYDRLARVSIELKNYDEAAIAARKATELNSGNSPELIQDYFVLGSALTELGRYGDARAAAARCVELAPTAPDYRLLLGDIAMRAKDYAAAEVRYLEALGLAPDSYRVHAGLGDVYEQENRHQSALQEYDAALRALNVDGQNNPDLQQQLVLNQANSIAGLKRYVEAEKLVRAVLAKAQDNPQVHAALAQVLDTAGKHEEAITEYRVALGKSAEDATLWGNLGWAQYNAGKYDEAVQSSRKALELDPKQSYVRFNLGLIYAVRNQWSDSRKEYQAALTGAAEADIRAGMNDLEDAEEKHADIDAIKQALQFLSLADHKALGFSD